MPQNRPFYLWRLFISFLLTSVLFILIFSFSYSILFMLQEGNSLKSEEIREDIEDISGYLEALECNKNLIQKSSEKLMNGVYKMSILERELGKDDRNVIKQKKEFSRLQYQDMKLISKYNEKCGENYVIVFYFYSNIEEDKDLTDLTEKVSFILGNFQRKYEDVMLYSLDFNINTFPVISLKKEFNLTSPPVVVIGGEKIVPENIDDLEELFYKEKRNNEYFNCLSNLNLSQNTKNNFARREIMDQIFNDSLTQEDFNNFISNDSLKKLENSFSGNFSLSEECSNFFDFASLINNYSEIGVENGN